MIDTFHKIIESTKLKTAFFLLLYLLIFLFVSNAIYNAYSLLGKQVHPDIIANFSSYNFEVVNFFVSEKVEINLLAMFIAVATIWLSRKLYLITLKATCSLVSDLKYIKAKSEGGIIAEKRELSDKYIKTEFNEARLFIMLAYSFIISATSISLIYLGTALYNDVGLKSINLVLILLAFNILLTVGMTSKTQKSAELLTLTDPQVEKEKLESEEDFKRSANINYFLLKIATELKL